MITKSSPTSASEQHPASWSLHTLEQAPSGLIIHCPAGPHALTSPFGHTFPTGFQADNSKLWLLRTSAWLSSRCRHHGHEEPVPEDAKRQGERDIGLKTECTWSAAGGPAGAAWKAGEKAAAAAGARGRAETGMGAGIRLRPGCCLGATMVARAFRSPPCVPEDTNPFWNLPAGIPH